MLFSIFLPTKKFLVINSENNSNWIRWYCSFACNELVPGLYRNLTLTPNFSITTRQKLKVKFYSDRVCSIKTSLHFKFMSSSFWEFRLKSLSLNVREQVCWNYCKEINMNFAYKRSFYLAKFQWYSIQVSS